MWPLITSSGARPYLPSHIVLHTQTMCQFRYETISESTHTSHPIVAIVAPITGKVVLMWSLITSSGARPYLPSHIVLHTQTMCRFRYETIADSTHTSHLIVAIVAPITGKVVLMWSLITSSGARPYLPSHIVLHTQIMCQSRDETISTHTSHPIVAPTKV